ncbi:Small glutamine-rich tetratricopeptide repeat-containing protein 2 [Didymosphaeria variabile]|uniref:Small glutamine-rich tetratricopeptide repeat-containing protein 2 n=1 Tax=Didymosphaeria variabile TaxID=1932322 RepID=A0A9W8XKW7_9PLEO|nr:Small glutamine-rich tetratricopeptide repeat-containing protein 2 [Didymosphaeria variabile]KAJ4353456.1 Small glutamine-rich tetratricopeptide repeat-containing protein 2 [Didymosphaeria variabile]
MASSAQSKKRLALAILDFLQTSQTDGSVAAEDAEQLEVAANCIGEAFKVDLSDSAAVKDALGDQNLLSIYNVYEKLKGKTTATTQGSSSASEARPATPQTPSSENVKAGPGGVNKDEAERLKGLGNEAMKKKDYAAAVKHYTAALDIVPKNPIYLSNRAAAHSGAGNHIDAKKDAEAARTHDLVSRNSPLGDAKGAMEAYKSGMDAEGGGSDVMRRGYETAKKKYEEEGSDDGALESEASRGVPSAGMGGMPDLASLANMFGGAGGRGGAEAGEGGRDEGGAGGMGGLAGLMNNPMIQQAMQSPAIQQMMQDPNALANMMNNPQLRQMAERFTGGGGAGGGGMPDLASMMNDPNIAEMARGFMGGAGRGGAGRGAGGSS